MESFKLSAGKKSMSILLYAVVLLFPLLFVSPAGARNPKPSSADGLAGQIASLEAQQQEAWNQLSLYVINKTCPTIHKPSPRASVDAPTKASARDTHGKGQMKRGQIPSSSPGASWA